MSPKKKIKEETLKIKHNSIFALHLKTHDNKKKLLQKKIYLIFLKSSFV